MIKNPTSHVSCLVFWLLLFKTLLAMADMAQNTTIPVNVGVILDLDSLFGKVGLSCVNMALSDFYASHAYYKTRLVLHTRDSMRDVVAEAAAALELIKDVEVQAIIIGPESSKEANFVVNLGDKAQVPVISFSTTSPSPATSQTSYFFRIAQDDSSQVKAISSIFQAFGWSEAVLIYVDNEFGEGVIPYLGNALQEVGARISYWSVIPPVVTDDHIVSKLQHLMTMKTRVGMMSEGYAWIMTDGMTNFFGSINSSAIDNMQGVLGLKTYIPNTQELEHFRVKWQQKFQNDNPTILNVKLDVFGLWAYDTAGALAMAVEKVGSSKNFSFQKTNTSDRANDLETLGFSLSGHQLVQALLSTIFRGLSGNFTLVNGQLQSSNFQIVNVIGSGERGLGYWTPKDGLVRNMKSANTNTSTNTYSTTSNASSLGPIIWPGDTTTIPKGWQNPNHGNTLKILVPVKRGFRELVNVTFDPSTNTTMITGFCIDVFKAAIEELPYIVSYDFYPFAKPNGEAAGSYNDLIFQLFLGNYDAGVGDTTNRANRSLYVDFTLPYTESGVSMVVPIKHSKSRQGALVFLKPFTWDLWVITCCCFILIGFVIWVLEHRINEDFGGPGGPGGPAVSFWFSFSTMAFAQKYTMIEPTLFNADSGFAFAFPKGSPLTLDVSRVITNLQEQGKIQSIKDKWFKKDAGCKRDPATTSISFNSLWGLFLLVGVSSAFALLVHAAMFFYHNRHLLILPDPNASLWQKLCKIVTFTL
ncbi:hypothetical protein C1H46_035554 [Malus baccata]|uniref:Ionotropic glutamate receptor C-terminal domain-containing protein n=1 Tax=Malus baccata TaxID=106549 RepID=A0A540KXF5_MALBA|nr:hypothetical protein C1H46_035554 [Malus baccata]